LKLKFVFDASPLIHLAKAGLGLLIIDLKGEKYTVPAVIQEVIKRGKELDRPDVAVTESLLESGVLTVKSPQKGEVNKIAKLHRDIHHGESEVIALAKEISAIALIDDRVARAVARIQGVRVEGSYGIILRAVLKGSISADGAEEALGALVRSGWRCDAELYSTLLTSMRRLAIHQAEK
jgi:predicted nucleic acid-binding protein